MNQKAKLESQEVDLRSQKMKQGISGQIVWEHHSTRGKMSTWEFSSTRYIKAFLIEIELISFWKIHGLFRTMKRVNERFEAGHMNDLIETTIVGILEAIIDR